MDCRTVVVVLNVNRSAADKYLMRFYEFNHIKTIKPLSPPQARLHKLKDVGERNKAAIKTEKEAQKRQKALDKQRKDLGRGRPTNNPNQTL
jgi:hypothetical protein